MTKVRPVAATVLLLLALGGCSATSPEENGTAPENGGVTPSSTPAPAPTRTAAPATSAAGQAAAPASSDPMASVYSAALARPGESCGTVTVGPTRISRAVYVMRGQQLCLDAVSTMMEYLDSLEEGDGLHRTLPNGFSCDTREGLYGAETGMESECRSEDGDTVIATRPAGSAVLPGTQVDPLDFPLRSKGVYGFTTEDGGTECHTGGYAGGPGMTCVTGRLGPSPVLVSLVADAPVTTAPAPAAAPARTFVGEASPMGQGTVMTSHEVSCRAEDASTVTCTTGGAGVVMDGTTAVVDNPAPFG